LIDYPLWKLNLNCVQVVVNEYDNDEVNEGDDIFQMDVLVNPYRLTLSVELENLNFHVIKNIYVFIGKSFGDVKYR
jgi:K+/H+ antiporter YhaU regulatory subunit KhtT